MSSTQPTVISPSTRNTPCTAASKARFPLFTFCLADNSNLYRNRIKKRCKIKQADTMSNSCKYKRKAGLFARFQGKTRLVYSSALYAATAPAAEMMSTASAEVAKSKNACAVSLSAAPSFVTSTNGRCTT